MSMRDSLKIGANFKFFFSFESMALGRFEDRYISVFFRGDLDRHDEGGEVRHSLLELGKIPFAAIESAFQPTNTRRKVSYSVDDYAGNSILNE